MDFLAEQRILYTSKKYEEIYRFFNENWKIKISDLFLLCASIGFKNNCFISFKEKGKEFRSNYFSSQQMSAVYSIILNDSILGKQIEKFGEAEFKKNASNKLEEYAEGGMKILCDEVFKNKWNGFELSSDYNEYDIDILSYIYQTSTEVPF